MCSPSLVANWALDVCGFFFRDTPEYVPEPEIDEFLCKGSPPIYIGFGSIVIDDPDELTERILQAVRATGVRAIISRGWSNLGANISSEYAFPDVLFIDDCPHEWLFQHVTAVVHHGGAGTTACGLRYGRPTVIVPFFGE
jgi:UDP:flavonoid glycosyltransferase YjiC (YdhE family)